MEIVLKKNGANSQRHSNPNAMKNASCTRRAIVETQIESDARNHPVLKVAPHDNRTNRGSMPPMRTSKLKTGKLTPSRTVT